MRHLSWHGAVKLPAVNPFISVWMWTVFWCAFCWPCAGPTSPPTKRSDCTHYSSTVRTVSGTRNSRSRPFARPKHASAPAAAAVRSVTAIWCRRPLDTAVRPFAEAFWRALRRPGGAACAPPSSQKCRIARSICWARERPLWATATGSLRRATAAGLLKVYQICKLLASVRGFVQEIGLLDGAGSGGGGGGGPSKSASAARIGVASPVISLSVGVVAPCSVAAASPMSLFAKNDSPMPNRFVGSLSHLLKLTTIFYWCTFQASIVTTYVRIHWLFASK